MPASLPPPPSPLAAATASATSPASFPIRCRQLLSSHLTLPPLPPPVIPTAPHVDSDDEGPLRSLFVLTRSNQDVELCTITDPRLLLACRSSPSSLPSSSTSLHRRRRRASPLPPEVTAAAGTGHQPIPEGWNSFVYIIEGEGVFGREKASPVSAHHCLVLGPGDGLSVWNKSGKPLRFAQVAGQPLNEPVVQHRPFVMNTHVEIQQAMEDYYYGRNGFEKARHWSST